MFKRMKILILSVLLVLAVAGCSSRDAQNPPTPQADNSPTRASSSAPVSSAPSESESESLASAAPSESEISQPEPDTPAADAGELTVHFGDDGAPFTMHLHDNATAAAIAGYVGTADWRLPIYEYDGYDNWEVMQFYDLPDRYEIPSNAETVTSQKSGEVYYSEPNRIVLFYGDAEVTGEYTPVGYFDPTAEFVTAVSGNPVLEGWENKIVLITD